MFVCVCAYIYIYIYIQTHTHMQGLAKKFLWWHHIYFWWLFDQWDLNTTIPMEEMFRLQMFRLVEKWVSFDHITCKYLGQPMNFLPNSN